MLQDVQQRVQGVQQQVHDVQQKVWDVQKKLGDHVTETKTAIAEISSEMKQLNARPLLTCPSSIGGNTRQDQSCEELKTVFCKARNYELRLTKSESDDLNSATSVRAVVSKILKLRHEMRDIRRYYHKMVGNAAGSADEILPEETKELIIGKQLR